MKNKLKILSAALAALFFALASMSFDNVLEVQDYPIELSKYGFFTGTLADMQPAENVLPYELNSPLFSDYSYKARFIRLPKDSQMVYHPTEVMDFPIGTAIIKTFYYPNDFRKPEKGRTLVETRVLLLEKTGWTALPYVWDEAQQEAYLEVAGETRNVSWKNEKGKKQNLEYSIPNMNQCKGCHLRGNKIKPIGPSARQLHNGKSYLTAWADDGYLKDLPVFADIPQMTAWDDNTATLDERARAYLDSNCAHCHHPDGPANTSGLYLHIYETDESKLGKFKAPIAAGRGAGDRNFNIVPGKPDESIFLYRMESEDPGVMMPELSRKLIHKEGVDLIREWIEAM